jgi:hypothetical protein
MHAAMNMDDNLEPKSNPDATTWWYRNDVATVTKQRADNIDKLVQIAKQEALDTALRPYDTRLGALRGIDPVALTGEDGEIFKQCIPLNTFGHIDYNVVDRRFFCAYLFPGDASAFEGEFKTFKYEEGKDNCYNVFKSQGATGTVQEPSKFRALRIQGSMIIELYHEADCDPTSIYKPTDWRMPGNFWRFMTDGANFAAGFDTFFSLDTPIYPDSNPACSCPIIYDERHEGYPPATASRLINAWKQLVDVTTINDLTLKDKNGIPIGYPMLKSLTDPEILAKMFYILGTSEGMVLNMRPFLLERIQACDLLVDDNSFRNFTIASMKLAGKDTNNTEAIEAEIEEYRTRAFAVMETFFDPLTTAQNFKWPFEDPCSPSLTPYSKGVRSIRLVPKNQDPPTYFYCTRPRKGVTRGVLMPDSVDLCGSEEKIILQEQSSLMPPL